MSQEDERYQIWLAQQQQALSAHEQLARGIVIARESIYGASLISYREMLQASGVDLPVYLTQKSAITSEIRVLDVGAGPGYAAEDIKANVPDAQVFALDAQEYPKARPRRNRTLPEIKRVRGSYFDARRLLTEVGAEDGVDVLLCMRAFFPQLFDKSALSFIAQRNLLGEFSSCLRIGGLALVTMEMNQENLGQMGGFQQTLEASGFSLKFKEMDIAAQHKFIITPVTPGGKMMIAKLERIK